MLLGRWGYGRPRVRYTASDQPACLDVGEGSELLLRAFLYLMRFSRTCPGSEQVGEWLRQFRQGTESAGRRKLAADPFSCELRQYLDKHVFQELRRRLPTLEGLGLKTFKYWWRDPAPKGDPPIGGT